MNVDPKNKLINELIYKSNLIFKLFKDKKLFDLTSS